MSTRICDGGHTSGKKVLRTPVQARSRATVDAIIGGTARVLAFRGYSGCTTNHIAEAAGVSIGSFYQYFADKDAAVGALAEQFAADTLAYSWEHLDDAADEHGRVHAWICALASRVATNEALLRVLFQEVPYIWTLPGVRSAMVGALDVVQRLDEVGGHRSQRRRERALIVIKSAVAVLLEIATDTKLAERRDVVVEELAEMIAGYLEQRRR